MNKERIRMINTHTGEVKETDACEAGLNSLCDVVDYEVNSYTNDSLFEGRDIMQDVYFEGNEDYVRSLNIYLKQKVLKSVK